jgi:hypothetical protein
MKNETLLNDPVERAVQKMLKAENEYINILTVMEEKMFGHLSKMLTSKEQTIIFYGIKVAIQLKMQTPCNTVKFLNTLLLII